MARREIEVQIGPVGGGKYGSAETRPPRKAKREKVKIILGGSNEEEEDYVSVGPTGPVKYGTLN